MMLPSVPLKMLVLPKLTLVTMINKLASTTTTILMENSYAHGITLAMILLILVVISTIRNVFLRMTDPQHVNVLKASNLTNERLPRVTSLHIPLTSLPIPTLLSVPKFKNVLMMTLRTLVELTKNATRTEMTSTYQHSIVFAKADGKEIKSFSKILLI